MHVNTVDCIRKRFASQGEAAALERKPLICMDEASKQLLADVQEAII